MHHILLLSLLLIAASANPLAYAPVNQQAYANIAVRIVHTPDISPGSSGIIEIAILNPYAQPADNVTLTLTIYSYANSTVDMPVASLPASRLPSLNGSISRSYIVGTLSPGEGRTLNITVQTHAHTLHGSFFSQSTYFVSEVLSMTVNHTSIRFASRGVFSQSEWNIIVEEVDGHQSVNYTYLNVLGYQGIIPDTSFGVNTPAPFYLFYAAALLSVLFAISALILYTHEKRGHSEKRGDERGREAPQLWRSGEHKRR